MLGKALEIVRIKKVPLDLNCSSKVVLVTFTNMEESVSLSKVHNVFSAFAKIEKVHSSCRFIFTEKIVIEKKKLTQAIIEFESEAEAVRIKNMTQVISERSGVGLKI